MVAAAVALACLARAATPAAPMAPAAAPALRVLVRVDTHAAERHVALAELIRTVRTIWKPYVDIVFADTADLGRDGFDDELQLVVSAHPGSAASGAAALGWITFVAPGRPGRFVTVSVATARDLMARDTWMGRRFDLLPPALQQQFVTRAVSWSAAHEIGHYLLRTSEHSPGGLMKAKLTAADIMRNDPHGVGLEPHEIEVLRSRATRTRFEARLGVDPPGARP